LEQQARCPHCNKKRRRKGRHSPIVYRTLFTSAGPASYSRH
jgi:DNA-directed RNA polymerase subunit RPC12/RpoP